MAVARSAKVSWLPMNNNVRPAPIAGSAVVLRSCWHRCPREDDFGDGFVVHKGTTWPVW